jgi:prephenate dehydrogenase (NADP+)
MVRPDITPDAPYDEQPVIGLIGMGGMGKMYAKHLSNAGWKR